METDGLGLALDEFISHLRLSKVLLMSLKEMVSIANQNRARKQQNSPWNRCFLSLHHVNALVCLSVLVCLRSLLIYTRRCQNLKCLCIEIFDNFFLIG